MPFGFYGFDRTYILVLIGVLLCVAASAKVKSAFAKYSRVRSLSGMTGAQAAEQLLRREGIYDVPTSAAMRCSTREDMCRLASGRLLSRWPILVPAWPGRFLSRG